MKTIFSIKALFTIFILTFLLITTDNFAQWVKVQNPGSRVLSYKTIGEELYVGTENNGILKSTNSGNNWTKIQTNLFETIYDINSFQTRSDTIWIGSYGGGVIASYDLGTTWHSFSMGFETQPFLLDIELIGDTLYAAITYEIGFLPSGVYKSSIHNSNWQLSGTGLSGTIFGVMDLLITSNGTMYLASALAGPKGNVNISLDNGKTWLNRAIPNIADVNILFEAGNKIYAGTSGGIFYTTNNGEAWFSLSEELNRYYVDDIIVYDNFIFAAVDQVGIIVSPDDGTTWNNISGNLVIEDDYISNIYIYKDHLFASLNAVNGVWKYPLSLTGNNDEELSNKFILAQNYPNPFNPTTSIK